MPCNARTARHTVWYHTGGVGDAQQDGDARRRAGEGGACPGLRSIFIYGDIVSSADVRGWVAAGDRGGFGSFEGGARGGK
jgi:hypothetical protein